MTPQGQNPETRYNTRQMTLNALFGDQMGNLGLYGQVELPNKA